MLFLEVQDILLVLIVEVVEIQFKSVLITVSIDGVVVVRRESAARSATYLSLGIYSTTTSERARNGNW